MSQDYQVTIKCTNVDKQFSQAFLKTLTSGDLKELLAAVQKVEQRIQAELKNASSDKNRR